MEIAEEGGRYYKRDESGTVTEISPAEYGEIATAKDTGSTEAEWVKMGELATNMLNVLPGVNLPTNPRAINALEDEQGAATMSGGAIFGGIGPTKIGALGNTLYSGGMGALQAPEGQRVQGGVIDAVMSNVGDIAANVTNRVLSSVKEAATGWTRQADPVPDSVARLEQRGYPLKPAQKTGSQAEMRQEREFEKTKVGQRKAGQIEDEQQRLLLEDANEAVGNGRVAEPLDSNARGVIAENLGDEFDRIGGDIDNVVLPDSTAKRLETYLNDDPLRELDWKPGDTNLKGKDYMALRSEVAEDLRGATESKDKKFLTKTLSQIDQAFEDQYPDLAEDYGVVRERWKNLVLMEKGAALDTNGLPNTRSMTKAFRNKQGYGPRGPAGSRPETQNFVQTLEDLSGRNVNPYIGNSGSPEGLVTSWTPQGLAKNLEASRYYRTGDDITERALNAFIDANSPAARMAGQWSGRAAGQGLLDWVD